MRRTKRAAALGFVAGLVYLAAGGKLPSLGEPATAPTASPVAPVVLPMHPHARVPERLAKALKEPASPATRAARPSAPGSHAGWAIPAGIVDVAQAQEANGRLRQVLPDGTQLELTLAPSLQRAAMAALRKYRVEYGVVVAIAPRTGDLLALAEYAEGRPDLRQMALQGDGPAASVFKIVTSAALIDKAGLTPASEICTHGGQRFLTLAHLDPDPRRDRKCTTLADALGQSNNVAFARWADQHLTPASLQAVAERFLFNRSIPFLWAVGVSQAQLPAGSRLGFAKSAAGFVGTTLSPLHGALIAATVANRGVMMTPRLVARATRGGVTLYEAQHAQLARVLSPETAASLGKMMVHTTTGEGTAARFFMRHKRPRIRGLTVAGKTGSLSARGGAARHYSWFVGFAPADKPQIALAALVVNGETWTTKGAVLAREVLTAWNDQRRAEARKKRVEERRKEREAKKKRRRSRP